MHRREFLYAGAALAGASISPAGWAEGLIDTNKISVERLANKTLPKAQTPLSVLFLGGTNFVGPPTVQRFVDRGHKVSLFNRGITNPYLFP